MSRKLYGTRVAHRKGGLKKWADGAPSLVRSRNIHEAALCIAATHDPRPEEVAIDTEAGRRHYFKVFTPLGVTPNGIGEAS